MYEILVCNDLLLSVSHKTVWSNQQYYLAHLSPHLLSEVDECSLNMEFYGLDACHADANCIDTADSYTCQCKDGFEGDGFNCVGEYHLYVIFGLSEGVHSNHSCLVLSTRFNLHEVGVP